jgi:lysophospholipase L1-like esterase
VNKPAAKPSLPRAKKALFLAVWALVPPLLLILAVEGGGRLYMHFKYGVPGKSYGLWRADAQLGAIHAEHGYNRIAVTNNMGFRNTEDVQTTRPPGSYRIIAYGGSTTFSYNLNNDETWPQQLENLLRAKHNAHDQVLNAGAIMWSVSHELARARRDLPVLKPDYVILYTGVNEEENARRLKQQGVDLAAAVREGRYGLFATNYDQDNWFIRNTMIGRYLNQRAADAADAVARDSVRNGRTVIDTTTDPVALAHFQVTLRAFIALIRQNGAIPIYVILAGLPELAHNARLLKYPRAGAAIARETGVQVLDAQTIVDGYGGHRNDLFFRSGHHWSAMGAKKLAAFIYENAFAVAASRSGAVATPR